MADAADLKSASREGVGVRVPSSAFFIRFFTAFHGSVYLFKQCISSIPGRKRIASYI
jgi:hypothetical protein